MMRLFDCVASMVPLFASAIWLLLIPKTSPELLRLSVSTVALMFRFTFALVVPIVTRTVLLWGTPLGFQFVLVPQLLSPPEPVHVAVVVGGGAFGFAASADPVAPIGSGLSTTW